MARGSRTLGLARSPALGGHCHIPFPWGACPQALSHVHFGGTPSPSQVLSFLMPTGRPRAPLSAHGRGPLLTLLDGPEETVLLLSLGLTHSQGCDLGAGGDQLSRTAPEGFAFFCPCPCDWSPHLWRGGGVCQAEGVKAPCAHPVPGTRIFQRALQASCFLCSPGSLLPAVCREDGENRHGFTLTFCHPAPWLH